MSPDPARAATNLALLRFLHPRTVPCQDCEAGHLCMECMAEAARDAAADRAEDEREERRG